MTDPDQIDPADFYPGEFVADNDAVHAPVSDPDLAGVAGVEPGTFATHDVHPTGRGGAGAGHPAVVAELADRIARLGSIRFDEYVELALYHPDGGFFASGGGAGRAGGDFITSPEVGPLFGAIVARYLDARWHDLGRPDPFVVVEAAAGRGALAISVLAARPECASALRYVLVERSAELRERQGEHLSLSHPFEVLGPEEDHDTELPAQGQGDGPLVCSLVDLPAQPVDGVVLANELLDNVPFRLLERAESGEWLEVRVTLDGDRLAELLVPADELLASRAERLARDAPAGARVPLQDGAADWLRDALGVVRSGSVLVLDYATTTADLASRPSHEWLRTYRRHERGNAPLDAPGTQDITCEVAIDQLDRIAHPDSDMSQSDWLTEWGMPALVEEGRRVWQDRQHTPDLAAIRAHSRIPESAALGDPSGLGAFRVLEWRR